MKFPVNFTRPGIIAMAAAAIAGVAAWVSRGALDVIGTADAPRRVAMLPSWPELTGLVALAVIAISAAALGRDTRRAGLASSGNSHARVPLWDADFADAVLPLFGLTLLLLPYLPWLPDWVPALQVLAGPSRWLIWAIVLGQVAWAFAPQVAARFSRVGLALRRKAPASLAIFATSLAIYAIAATQLMKTDYVPGGDEPHYLIVTQSLLRDHDLKIENNHLRGDYREYFRFGLDPDYRTRGTDGQIYSIHPIGLPMLALPAFALGGYQGVVWLLMLLAAATALMMWRWVLSLTGSASAATFSWAGVCLTPPFVFNSFTVYPEIPAAFCVMCAALSIGGGTSDQTPQIRLRRLGTSALAVAALPWLSTKYIGLAGVLSLLLAWRWRQSPRRVALIMGIPGLSVFCWLLFFFMIWGSPLPTAPYGPDPQTNLLTFFSGGPGLLFDQEYGIVAWAPVLMLALLGLAGMVRASATRRVAIEIGSAVVALLVLVGSFQLWWGGAAAPGRPVVAMLPLLGLPVAWCYQRATRSQVQRAACHLLLFISLALTITLIFAVNGLLVVQHRDGSSSLLEWLSPTWQLWAALPSYILNRPTAAAFQTLVWMAGVGLVVAMCRRARLRSPGESSLFVTICVAAVSVVVASVSPLLPGPRSQPRVDPEARVLVPMLDHFDATARPIGIKYDPFSIVAPSEVPGLFWLAATPGQRRSPQPTAVLLNARFRLPAGQYEFELQPSASANGPVSGDIGVQVGREGQPMRTWPVTIPAGGFWRQHFSLPLDAEFVAFRASAELGRSLAALRLRPTAIVDASRRLHTDAIFASAAFGPTLVFFHDAVSYIEPGGFWARGRARMRVTLVKSDRDQMLTLNVHSGARPNQVIFATPRWSERINLAPNATQTVVVPSRSSESLVPLEITTTAGFVPAEIEPANKDRRLLGCWITFP